MTTPKEPWYSKCWDYIKDNPTLMALIGGTIALFIMLYTWPTLIPDYEHNIMIRTMLTNSVGLLAILTFTANIMIGTSKDNFNRNNTYLGVEVNSFFLIHSAFTRIISGLPFKIGVSLLFLLPIIYFEIPALASIVVIPLWWSLFGIISSLLLLNILNTISIIRPQYIRFRIRKHKIKKWHAFVNGVLSKSTTPYDSYAWHKYYLLEYEAIKPEDHSDYLKYILNNLSPIDSAIYTLLSSPPKISSGPIYDFLSGRLQALIEHLEETDDPRTINELFQLISNTVEIHQNASGNLNSKNSEKLTVCSEDQVSRIRLLTPESSKFDKTVQVIPAVTYNEISYKIHEGKINLSQKDLRVLVSSIDNIKHQATKEYAAKQLIEAIFTASFLNFGNPQLNINIVEAMPYLNPYADPIGDECMLRKLAFSFAERKIISGESLPNGSYKNLLKFTSYNLRIANLFVTLFKNKESFDLKLAEYLTQEIEPVDLTSKDEFVDEPLQYDSDLLKFEAGKVKEMIYKFDSRPLNMTLMNIRDGGALEWLFDILKKPITCDMYREFEKQNFKRFFRFRTVVLWRTLVSTEIYDNLYYLLDGASGYSGMFYKSDQDQSDLIDLKEATEEVDKAADLLEGFGRKEEAKMLRRSIATK
ncbi:hypothetical protein [Actinomyces sp. ZJ308]|uniref:hypothetical protein n=1 Tax=Actinomyces sp. ZJ308 TaxID=2708342 RepID=UPI0014232BA4|nr:hypothetical protein [Actinomyces sp. ZJ308]